MKTKNTKESINFFSFLRYFIYIKILDLIKNLSKIYFYL